VTRIPFLISLILVGTNAYASDGFEGVRCGSDVAHVLMGRRMPNERVQAFETRHRPLGLKELGADQISDELSAENWRICGSEFVLLVDSADMIRDVLSLPNHSRRFPEFSGICATRGRPTPFTIEAILNAGKGRRVSDTSHYAATDQTLLPAMAAWKVDEATKKFIALDPAGLRCPRNGILTIDGGP
jgi:hypothetical protein